MLHVIQLMPFRKAIKFKFKMRKLFLRSLVILICSSLSLQTQFTPDSVGICIYVFHELNLFRTPWTRQHRQIITKNITILAFVTAIYSLKRVTIIVAAIQHAQRV